MAITLPYIHTNTHTHTRPSSPLLSLPHTPTPMCTQAVKSAKQAAEDERREASTWNEGSDLRGKKKRGEAERKAAEKDAAAAAKRAALAEEEAMAMNVKPKVKVAGKKANAKSKEMAELEAQLKAMELEKKKKEEKLKAAASGGGGGVAKGKGSSSKKKKGGGGDDSDESEEDYYDDLPPLEANPNRKGADIESARNLDQAIDLLGSGGGGAAGGGGDEKHPEKRMKAAYKAYEEQMLPQMKDEFPGLKLRQYQNMIFEKWQKAPQNPKVQAALRGNA